MNILIATNVNYLFATKVMLYSLAKNEDCKINVYLLHSTLQDSHKKDIDQSLSQCKNIHIEYINVGPSIFDSLQLYDHLSKETFYRILAQDLLPQDMERILYIDVDLIINHPIDEFYHMSFIENNDEKYFIVAEGPGISFKQFKIYDNIEMPHNLPYFNAGVMLMNLKQLRQKVVMEDYIQFIQEHRDRLLYHDQDILNGMFYQNVKYVDWKIYNRTIIHIHTLEEAKDAQDHAVIIHYAGKSKPWHKDYESFLYDDFWHYGKVIDRKLYYKITLSHHFMNTKKMIRKVIKGN